MNFDATTLAVLDLSVADSEPQLVPPGQTVEQFADTLGLADWATVEVPAPHEPGCPIRGHNHTLTHRRELTQDGTGQKADIWACATNQADPSVDRYRWFLLRGRELTNLTRMSKPRFGWNSKGIDK